MANASLPQPQENGGMLSSSQQKPEGLVVSPGETSDSAGDEESLFADADDAQSIVQPALSPQATRLTSPRTPAAEKAAAMDRIPSSDLFSVIEGTATSDFASVRKEEDAPGPRKLVKAPNRQNRGFSLGQLPPSQPLSPRFPSPWQSGPRELVIQNESGSGSRPALSSVFGSTRHRRSSSGGAEAFRRLKDALPNITLPTNFLSSLTSPSFFSGNTSQKSPNQELKQSSLDGTSESRFAPPLPGQTTQSGDDGASTNLLAAPSASSRPGTMATSRPRLIRKSTSDESMLYHSLSRMSSLGDDDKWGNVREQTNIRFKAIKESIDRPNFKLPQLPDVLKRHSLLGSETPDPRSTVQSPTTSQFASSSRDGLVSDFDRTLEMLTGDVVIMGGYRGSILRSTKTNRQVWVPVKVGLNIRKVNLEVGLDPEDEERMEESIYPSGMLQNIGPVDISKRLFKRLRECENAKNGKLRVWDYGWDWRLSPYLLSRKLVSFLEKLPSNQSDTPEEKGATVIAHSLGGLITRHAVNQRPDLFAGVVYAGTPQRCINILGPIRNGDVVLLNEKVLTAQVNFSLRTSFVFLPEDGFCFINKYTGEEYPIDFYDAEDWAKHSLSPCVETVLPAFNARQSSLGSFLNLSNSLPNLPLRSRGNSSASERPQGSPTRHGFVDGMRRAEAHHDRTLAPQMGTLAADSKSAQQQQASPKSFTERERYMAYLKRTLADTKKFRAELQHQPHLTESNSYPPMAIMYGKEIPTVYAVHVTSRDAIPCTDAYDDLLFRSGDGVVLAREAMLPPGYDVVNGGRVSTDRGHITMLGDLAAVGKALEAVVRGRRKGIGMGTGQLTQGAKASQV
ncbi:uncharacterized protein JN550_010869 [Neoarthrinium moseri]|uniref:uncharacterized protein n=1 Tax=Neoarthrinium moseri TaxID=1658444 RepID=UPI001FDC7398|nr:uncharacterized protein JN550_010869 [Neoarthrinium moseri]KAI1861339.1 hypothetical protein JN550_010869 [Neoarthrinium moseri]